MDNWWTLDVLTRGRGEAIGHCQFFWLHTFTRTGLTHLFRIRDFFTWSERVNGIRSYLDLSGRVVSAVVISTGTMDTELQATLGRYKHCLSEICKFYTHEDILRYLEYHRELTNRSENRLYKSLGGAKSVKMTKLGTGFMSLMIASWEKNAKSNLLAALIRYSKDDGDRYFRKNRRTINK